MEKKVKIGALLVQILMCITLSYSQDSLKNDYYFKKNMTEVYSIESIQVKYFNVEYLIAMEDIGSGTYITAVNLYRVVLNKKYLVSENRIFKNHRDISISIYNG